MAVENSNTPLKWSRAIVGTRSELSINRLVGKLADGIVLQELTTRDFEELRSIIGLDDTEDPKKYRLLLLIREDVFCELSATKQGNRARYYNLISKLSTFIRITTDPDAFIAKKQAFEYTCIDFDDSKLRNNTYSHHWPKLLNVYDENKTTFLLFSAATVTDRTDVIFNLMNSVISLESLLLHGDSGENAYKFRIRGAYLLSSSPNERELVYCFLKYAYDLRSAVVHSNDLLRRKLRKRLKEEYGFSFYEANAELIKMNRFMLKLFLNKPSLFENLDAVVLQGGHKGESYTNTHMKEKLKARAKTFRALRRKAEQEKRNKTPK